MQVLAGGGGVGLQETKPTSGHRQLVEGLRRGCGSQGQGKAVCGVCHAQGTVYAESKQDVLPPAPSALSPVQCPPTPFTVLDVVSKWKESRCTHVCTVVVLCRLVSRPMRLVVHWCCPNVSLMC